MTSESGSARSRKTCWAATLADGDRKHDDGEKEADVILRVQICGICLFSSNSENPFKRGPLGLLSCNPWHQGTPMNPLGELCRACVRTFSNGQWHVTYRTIGKFKKVCDKDKEVHTEFMTSRTVFIQMVNEGHERFGKEVLKDFSSRVEDAKRRTVTLDHKKKENVKIPFRGFTVERFQEKFKKSPPPELPRKLVGGVEYVMVRKLHAQEIDLDLEDETAVTMQEMLDDGESNLRENQQQIVYDGCAEMIGGQALSNSGVSLDELLQSIEDVVGSGNDPDDDGGVDDDVSEDFVEEHDFFAHLTSGIISGTPKDKVAKKTPPPATKVTPARPSTVARAAKSSPPTTSPVAPVKFEQQLMPVKFEQRKPPSEHRPRSSSVRSRSPSISVKDDMSDESKSRGRPRESGVIAVLESIHFNAYESQVLEIETSLSIDPALACSFTTPGSSEKAQKALKPILKEWNTVKAKVTEMAAKLKRRKEVPAEVTEKMNQLQRRISLQLVVVSTAMKGEPTALLKLTSNVDELYHNWAIKLPLYMETMMFVALVTDKSRKGQHDEVGTLMKLDMLCFLPAASFQEFRIAVLHILIESLAGSIRLEGADACPKSASAFASIVKTCLAFKTWLVDDAETVADLQKFIDWASLATDKEVALGDQLSLANEIVVAAKNPKYTGVFGIIATLKQFPAMNSMVQSAANRKKRADGRSRHLVDAGEFLQKELRQDVDFEERAPVNSFRKHIDAACEYVMEFGKAGRDFICLEGLCASIGDAAEVFCSRLIETLMQIMQEVAKSAEADYEWMLESQERTMAVMRYADVWSKLNSICTSEAISKSQEKYKKACARAESCMTATTSFTTANECNRDSACLQQLLAAWPIFNSAVESVGDKDLTAAALSMAPTFDSTKLGCSQYQEDLSKFKDCVREVVKLAMQKGAKKMEDKLATWKDQWHKCKQLASYSATPTRDVEGLDVAEHLQFLLAASFSVNGVKDDKDSEACSKACNNLADRPRVMEACKNFRSNTETFQQHLEWLFSQDAPLVPKAVDFLHRMTSVLSAGAHTDLDAVDNEWTNLRKGVESLIGTDGPTEEKMLEVLSQAKANKLKAFHAQLDTLRDKYERTAKNSGMVDPEKVSEITTLMKRCKCTSCKWGVLTIMSSKQMKQESTRPGCILALQNILENFVDEDLREGPFKMSEQLLDDVQKLAAAAPTKVAAAPTKIRRQNAFVAPSEASASSTQPATPVVEASPRKRRKVDTSIHDVD